MLPWINPAGDHMSNTHTVELPADLAAFAQTQVDTGRYGSIAEVVRDGLGLLQSRTQQVIALRKELDVGIAQLDAGHSTRGTPRELMDGIRAELGLARSS